MQKHFARHGPRNLLAPLAATTGGVKAAITQLKRRAEFLQFMDQVVAEAQSERFTTAEYYR